MYIHHNKHKCCVIFVTFVYFEFHSIFKSPTRRPFARDYLTIHNQTLESLNYTS